MHMLTLPARQTGKSRFADAVAMSISGPLAPAAYLKLRREAAGVSVDDFARALVTLAAHHLPVPKKRPPLKVLAARFVEMRDLVLLLERPGHVARLDRTLTAIAGILPFDPDVYRQLAADPVDRHPRVCRSCGCSGHDACSTDTAVCSWATPALCSFCVEVGLRAIGVAA